MCGPALTLLAVQASLCVCHSLAEGVYLLLKQAYATLRFSGGIVLGMEPRSPCLWSKCSSTEFIALVKSVTLDTFLLSFWPWIGYLAWYPRTSMIWSRGALFIPNTRLFPKNRPCVLLEQPFKLVVKRLPGGSFFSLSPCIICACATVCI